MKRYHTLCAEDATYKRLKQMKAQTGVPLIKLLSLVVKSYTATSEQKQSI